MSSPGSVGRPTRRQALTLAAIGMTGAGAALARPRAAAAAVAPPNGACLLPPQSEEGPFYFDPKLLRSDITEGRQGVPVKLRLQVIGTDCRPIPGARVDIWHADAQGIYSGYEGQGDARTIDTRRQSFLRGTQLADAAGETLFTTIFPGWYRGRTTHIHLKVFLGGNTVLTGQIFLPDAINEFIYTNVAGYKRRDQRDTLNATDHIALDATDAAFAAVKEEKGHYLISLVVGVDPAARPAAEGRGPGGPPGPPPPGPPPPGLPLGGEPGPPGGLPGLSGEDRMKALVPGSSDG